MITSSRLVLAQTLTVLRVYQYSSGERDNELRIVILVEMYRGFKYLNITCRSRQPEETPPPPPPPPTRKQKTDSQISTVTDKQDRWKWGWRERQAMGSEHECRAGSCHALLVQNENMKLAADTTTQRWDLRHADSPRLLFSLMLFSCSCSNRTVNNNSRKKCWLTGSPSWVSRLSEQVVQAIGLVVKS